MKTSRRRLDVDVEELDRVIDAAENGPLSKTDRQKLKTTLHALVERLAQKRNTEKTNSVLEPKNSSSAATESPEPAALAGFWRWRQRNCPGSRSARRMTSATPRVAPRRAVHPHRDS